MWVLRRAGKLAGRDVGFEGVGDVPVVLHAPALVALRVVADLDVVELRHTGMYPRPPQSLKTVGPPV